MEFVNKGDERSFSPDRDLAWLFQGLIAQALQRLKLNQTHASTTSFRAEFVEDKDLVVAAEAMLAFMYQENIKLVPGETRVGRCRKEFDEMFAKVEPNALLLLMAEIGFLTTWTSWLGWRDAMWRGSGGASPAVNREELQVFAAEVGKASTARECHMRTDNGVTNICLPGDAKILLWSETADRPVKRIDQLVAGDRLFDGVRVVAIGQEALTNPVDGDGKAAP